MVVLVVVVIIVEVVVVVVGPTVGPGPKCATPISIMGTIIGQLLITLR